MNHITGNLDNLLQQPYKQIGMHLIRNDNFIYLSHDGYIWNFYNPSNLLEKDVTYDSLILYLHVSTYGKISSEFNLRSNKVKGGDSCHGK